MTFLILHLFTAYFTSTFATQISGNPGDVLPGLPGFGGLGIGGGLGSKLQSLKVPPTVIKGPVSGPTIIQGQVVPPAIIKGAIVPPTIIKGSVGPKNLLRGPSAIIDFNDVTGGLGRVLGGGLTGGFNGGGFPGPFGGGLGQLPGITRTKGGGIVGVSPIGVAVKGPKPVPAVISGPSGKVVAGVPKLF